MSDQDEIEFWGMFSVGLLLIIFVMAFLVSFTSIKTQNHHLFSQLPHFPPCNRLPHFSQIFGFILSMVSDVVIHFEMPSRK